MARAQELRRLRRQLLARYAALRKSLAKDLSDLGDQGHTATPDDLDLATETTSDHIASQLAERESQELAQIGEALRRMKEGRFGRCEICGCKIPMERLKVLLYTSTCVGCQRERERDPDYTGGADGGQNWQKVFDEESRRKDAEKDYGDFVLDLSAESR